MTLSFTEGPFTLKVRPHLLSLSGKQAFACEPGLVYGEASATATLASKKYAAEGGPTNRVYGPAFHAIISLLIEKPSKPKTVNVLLVFLQTGF